MNASSLHIWLVHNTENLKWLHSFAYGPLVLLQIFGCDNDWITSFKANAIVKAASFIAFLESLTFLGDPYYQVLMINTSTDPAITVPLYSSVKLFQNDPLQVPSYKLAESYQSSSPNDITVEVHICSYVITTIENCIHRFVLSSWTDSNLVEEMIFQILVSLFLIHSFPITYEAMHLWNKMFTLPPYTICILLP